MARPRLETVGFIDLEFYSLGRIALLPGGRDPVDDEINERVGLLAPVEDEEALVVRGRAELGAGGYRRAGELEEGLWRSDLDRVSPGGDLDRPDLAGEAVINDFPPVLAPERIGALFRRDLPFPSRAGKGRHVDVKLARFVRAIDEP